MKPKISDTEFGSITINEKTFGHDVIIRLNGEIKKRKKFLIVNFNITPLLSINRLIDKNLGI